MSEKEFWEELKKTFLFSDEDLKKLTPLHLKRYKRRPALRGYKIVAEVVKAEHCALNKVGDRYVFELGGRILTDESSPLCLWALAYMLPFAYMVYDRIVEGLDPNGISFNHVACSDTGLEYGGTGRVVFKIYVEKK